MNEVIIARIDDAWAEFLPLLDGLSDEAVDQPGVCGYYSLKDLVAHLAYWEDQTREVVESGHDGSFDVETVNDRVYARYRDTPYVELRKWLIDGHARARETFATARDLTEDDVKDDTWEHWQEHGNQIRSWRSKASL